MKAQHRGSVERCAGFGTLPKGFLQPSLLLMLQEQPGYGYDLVIRLKALGIDDDSASVYRALRTLEENDAVSSYWYTSSTGPARHMYRITPAGRDRLQARGQDGGGDAPGHRAVPLPLCPDPVPPAGARRPVCSLAFPDLLGGVRRYRRG